MMAHGATGLTQSLLQLFAPREPMGVVELSRKRKMPPYSGIAQYVGLFASPGDDDYAPTATRGERPYWDSKRPCWSAVEPL
jgi:U1 small nuclear ribonucleoprotein